jgi:hypothetical protein
MKERRKKEEKSKGTIQQSNKNPSNIKTYAEQNVEKRV